LEGSYRKLRDNPVLLSEIEELLQFRIQTIASVPPHLDLRFICPLQLHSQYTRDEILAALGHWTVEYQKEMREGVLCLPELPADIFFITLNKTEEQYSPTTMYEDYAISDNLFHWQSQSTTSVESPTGQRYINHDINGHTILLFVRQDKKSNYGLSEPYYFLGPADYESHTGSKPISFLWRLRYRMPAHLARTTNRLISF